MASDCTRACVINMRKIVLLTRLGIFWYSDCKSTHGASLGNLGIVHQVECYVCDLVNLRGMLCSSFDWYIHCEIDHKRIEFIFDDCNQGMTIIKISSIDRIEINGCRLALPAVKCRIVTHYFCNLLEFVDRWMLQPFDSYIEMSIFTPANGNMVAILAHFHHCGIYSLAWILEIIPAILRARVARGLGANLFLQAYQ